MYNIAIRRKYGPYKGTYTNIAKTASASLYCQCYNPISYSGHPRGSTKYRLAKMWGGGGCTRVISGPRPISIYRYICSETYLYNPLIRGHIYAVKPVISNKYAVKYLIREH